MELIIYDDVIYEDPHGSCLVQCAKNNHVSRSHFRPEIFFLWSFPGSFPLFNNKVNFSFHLKVEKWGRHMSKSMNTYNAQCSEWVCKPKFFGDGFFDFNVTFWMCIMRIYSLKLPICHENIAKMVLNPVHLEHFSKNCLTLWVFTTVTCNFLVQ